MSAAADLTPHPRADVTGQIRRNAVNSSAKAVIPAVNMTPAVT